MIDRTADPQVVAALLRFLAWSWPFIFTVVYVGLAVTASAHVVLFKRDGRSAVAWVGLIWLSPVLGPILYLMFGINRIRRRASRLRTTGRSPEGLFGEGAMLPPAHELEEEGMPPQTLEAAAELPTAPALDADLQSHSGLGALHAFLGKVTGRRLTEGNRVTPLVNGDAGYPAMLEAIDRAQRSVALCTYIFDHDRAGRRFVEALAAAHRRGVTVRVLIDGVGVRYSRPRITGLLDAEGVPYAKFLKSMYPWRNPYLNLRNHRKLLVVDGRIGFTGGLNIREGCILELATSHPVQDLHFRFEGPVVRHLMEDFSVDWEFTTGELLAGEDWLPELEAAGTVRARGIPDGPDENFETSRWALLGALTAAQKSVRIVTPYFIPDQTLIAALDLTALRGVPVEIVLPAKSNLRFVQWASTAQLWQVLVNGCRIFLSPPPFDHSKMMVVDGEWSFVGSSNWDARSLRLNFEYNVECYDVDLAAQIDRLIDDKIAAGRELLLGEIHDRPLPIKLRDGLVRLAAPYL